MHGGDADTQQAQHGPQPHQLSTPPQQQQQQQHLAIEKPPELIAFDTGREVMEQLRNKHASVSVALEALCAEIGECKIVVSPTPTTAALSVMTNSLND